MISVATRKTQKTASSTILQRIAEKDKTAIKDCVDAYGNFIWALARKFTDSRVKAEAATEEIFTDIWRISESDCNTQSTEKKVIVTIALRRLTNRFKSAEQISMRNIYTPNEQGAVMGRISESI